MDFAAARARLVAELRAEIKDKRVLEAMIRVPRELFVSPEERHLAYEDSPLPIGLGQTISQPLIVALMTEALELKGNEKVLEIGTGSGYQTALLAELAQTVISVERLPHLAESAAKRLDELGYHNVAIHLAEEKLGWEKEAPYDAIIVTAAAPHVPPCLLAQLSVGGRMVIPVGSRYLQNLYKIIKKRKRNLILDLGGCSFVSLINKEAWAEE